MRVSRSTSPRPSRFAPDWRLRRSLEFLEAAVDSLPSLSRAVRFCDRLLAHLCPLEDALGAAHSHDEHLLAQVAKESPALVARVEQLRAEGQRLLDQLNQLRAEASRVRNLPARGERLSFDRLVSLRGRAQAWINACRVYQRGVTACVQEGLLRDNGVSG